MFVLGWLGFWFLLYTRSTGQAAVPVPDGGAHPAAALGASCWSVPRHRLLGPPLGRTSTVSQRKPLQDRQRPFRAPSPPSYNDTKNGLFRHNSAAMVQPLPPPPLRPLISPQASLGGESIISMAVADSRHKPPHQHAASHARYATGLTATAAHSNRRWGGADFRKGGSLQKAAPGCIEPKRPKEQRPTEDPSCTS